MRKGIVAILAVAIIGALGLYNNNHKAKSSAAVQSANTLAPIATTTTSAANESTNPTAASTPSASASTGAYKDGTYTGTQINTAYGPVRVATVISGGKIVDVKFVSMPDDRGHSQEVTNESAPLLKQSTLAKQSAHIDFVSGATQTSEGYQQSLQSALDQAA